MVKEFNYKGHHYKVVPIEGCEDYTIIKDGRNTCRVNKEVAANATMYVDKLF